MSGNIADEVPSPPEPVTEDTVPACGCRAEQEKFMGDVNVQIEMLYDQMRVLAGST